MREVGGDTLDFRMYAMDYFIAYLRTHNENDFLMYKTYSAIADALMKRQANNKVREVLISTKGDMSIKDKVSNKIQGAILWIKSKLNSR